ncbi:helix-turn-helix domain-containing protein [Streptomyces sp. NPDC002513]
MEPLTAIPRDVLERDDVRHALAAHEFGTLFKLIRKWTGISFNRIAEACDIKSSRVSQIARGEAVISTIAKIEHIADAFRIPGHYLRLAPRPWEMSYAQSASEVESERLPLLVEGRGDTYAQAIRDTSKRLIVLDNELSGLPIAEMAARAFKAVHRRLGEGDYEPRYEQDIRAAAAELAEVAGWALFDAENHSAARRFNQEALFLAKLSGDRAIELLILQNMAMQAGWLGRSREELAISRSILDYGTLSPRIEAIFRVREAKGLAQSGQGAEAAITFNRARSLAQESDRNSDPFWSWWVTVDEIDGNQGFALQESEQWKSAIPYLLRALRQEAGAKVGYRNISAVRLLDCYLEVHAWREAQELSESIIPTVGETTSARTLKLLDRTSQKGISLTESPTSMRDTLEHMGHLINEDPYVF